MSEKVKVSREVANFIESCKSNGTFYWEDELLYGHASFMNGSDVAVREDAKCLNKYSTFELAQILVLGYEVEETPEEKIKEKYELFTDTTSFNKGFVDGYSLGVKNVLKILGIEIKGINK